MVKFNLIWNKFLMVKTTFAVLLSVCNRSTMAWRSSGLTNANLISNLEANGVIRNARVSEAMGAIDRGFYSKNNPYMDSPQLIGYSVTISAPHMVEGI